jgi:uncharacterized membrane protein
VLLRVIGLVGVVALLVVPRFAAADIVAGLLPDSDADSVLVIDAHPGAAVGVLAAGGFFAQAVRANIVGLQQVALVVVALAAGAQLAGAPVGLIGAAFVAVR